MNAVREMSEKFTSKRRAIHDYLSSRLHVEAYTWFYHPTNQPKLEWLLKKLPRPILEQMSKGVFFDIGSGPGTYAYAVSEMAENGILPNLPQLCLIETSALMREKARHLHLTHYNYVPSINFLKSLPNGADQIPMYKTAFFGNSLNEMGVKKGLEYIKKLSPELLLIIEPGTKEFFEAFLSLRQELLETNWDVLFPCQNSSFCPLTRDPRDWCHSVIHPQFDPEIHRRMQLVGIDRRTLPFMGAIFTKVQNGLASHETGNYKKVNQSEENDRKKLEKHENTISTDKVILKEDKGSGLNSDIISHHVTALVLRKLYSNKGEIAFLICFINHDTSAHPIHKIGKAIFQKRNYSKKRLKDLENLYAGSEFLATRLLWKEEELKVLDFELVRTHSGTV